MPNRPLSHTSRKEPFMNLNPAKLFQLKASWERFTNAHPKLPMFLRAISRNNVIQPDTIVDITITTPDGKNFSTNIKLTPEDIRFYEDAKEALK